MLTKLEIKATRDTPEVLLDAKNGVLEIKGSSLPEDSVRFYEPVLDWLSKYIENPNKNTLLVCKLDYFNSSSAKMLYDVFFELEKIPVLGKEVVVHWYFAPDDKLIEEKGQEYQSILEMPFELKELS